MSQSNTMKFTKPFYMIQKCSADASYFKWAWKSKFNGEVLILFRQNIAYLLTSLVKMKCGITNAFKDTWHFVLSSAGSLVSYNVYVKYIGILWYLLVTTLLNMY